MVGRFRTAKLNSSGKPKVTYKIGQHVAIYLPPSQEQAQKHNRKVKHFPQFAGPAVIKEALSDNGTAYRVMYKTKTYDRHITNLYSWPCITNTGSRSVLVI